MDSGTNGFSTSSWNVREDHQIGNLVIFCSFTIDAWRLLLGAINALGVQRITLGSCSPSDPSSVMSARSH
jgi:hypothetical protein